MRAEVSVEGRVRSDTGSYVDSSGTITGGSRAGVALVARVPLYSAAEMDREREREYARRVKVADAVGAFVTALGEREKHQRELALMRALERRSQERVKIGVAETAEQVRYLERVASIEGELLKLRGQIQKARLEMIGHCSAPTADGLDRHLVQFIGQ
jgi:chromosome segregation ATPase